MPSRGRIRAVVVVAGVFLCLSTAGLALAADEVRFTASVDRREVPLNGLVTLTVSVSVPDRSRNYEMKLPNTGTLQKVGSSTSSNTQISFSGRSTVALVTENTVLRLQPTNVGYASIGPATMRYRGNLYKTKAIRIKVTKASKQQPGQRRRPTGRRFPSMLDDDWFRSPFDDDMFRSPFDKMRRTPEPVDENALYVRAIATPAEVVENQQVTLSVVIYSQVGGRVEPVRWPKLDGFYSVERDVSAAKTQTRVIDGVTYQVKVLAQKALFPLHAGEMVIDPIAVDVELSRSPFFPQTRQLKTRAVRIKVQDLPEKDRPAGFSPANVGAYKLSATLDSTQVKLNQPVTYRLEVRGRGNIQRLRPPALPQLDRFKMFDPTVDVQVAEKGEFVKGAKSFEYILLPLSSGKLTIPSLTFSYYDVDDKAFRTLRTEPKQIEVVADTSDDSIPGMAKSGREVNILAGAFKPIRFQSELRGTGTPFYTHALFIPLLVIPPVLLLLLLVAGWVRGQLQVDSPRLRMRRALVASKQDLRRSRRLLANGQADAFYAALKAALLHLVESLLGVPGQGLTMADMRKRLADAGLVAQQVESLVREIENCDFGQFAPSVRRGDEMQAALERVSEMSKSIKRPAVRARHRGHGA